PARTAEILWRWLLGELGLARVDIVDLDEDKYRRDEWAVRLYLTGWAPFEPTLVQSAKAVARALPVDKTLLGIDALVDGRARCRPRRGADPRARRPPSRRPAGAQPDRRPGLRARPREPAAQPGGYPPHRRRQHPGAVDAGQARPHAGAAIRHRGRKSRC